MKHLTTAATLGIFAALVFGQACSEFTTPELDRQDRTLTKKLQKAEQAKTDPNDAPKGATWVLRSKHFLFGMPRLKDDRHDLVPPDQKARQPGISVMVREGFVVAQFDRMLVPLWVCQRWTCVDHARMLLTPTQDRPWKIDLELPPYAQAADTGYAFTETQMQRGHLAQHAWNRAWGVDSSQMGCLMSNSAPQHKEVNTGPAWRTLEDGLQDAVVNDGLGIQAIWTVSGTMFRDKGAEQPPEKEFAKVRRIGDGYGLPAATYKVVGWFDKSSRFHTRGYVFEQTDRKPDPNAYLTPIADIEERTGVDFFPMLRDDIEKPVEKAKAKSMWSEE